MQRIVFDKATGIVLGHSNNAKGTETDGYKDEKVGRINAIDDPIPTGEQDRAYVVINGAVYRRLDEDFLTADELATKQKIVDIADAQAKIDEAVADKSVPQVIVDVLAAIRKVLS